MVDRIKNAGHLSNAQEMLVIIFIISSIHSSLKLYNAEQFKEETHKSHQVHLYVR